MGNIETWGAQTRCVPPHNCRPRSAPSNSRACWREWTLCPMSLRRRQHRLWQALVVQHARRRPTARCLSCRPPCHRHPQRPRCWPRCMPGCTLPWAPRCGLELVLPATTSVAAGRRAGGPIRHRAAPPRRSPTRARSWRLAWTRWRLLSCATSWAQRLGWSSQPPSCLTTPPPRAWPRSSPTSCSSATRQHAAAAAPARPPQPPPG